MHVAIDALASKLAQHFAARGAPGSWEPLARRLEAHGPRLLQLLSEIYGDRPDLARHAEAILETAARAWLERVPFRVKLRRSPSRYATTTHWRTSRE